MVFVASWPLLWGTILSRYHSDQLRRKNAPKYRGNSILNKSARICWEYQTYDNALMAEIQQSFASIIVRPAWWTAFLEALIGRSKIHLNRKSRRICRYLTDGRTSLTKFMAGRITRLSIANFFLPLNYGSQLWKPCATLVERNIDDWNR